MTRDLDTLLRDAVATTPLATDAVLDRARTIRRRRTAGRVAAALAVAAVVGTGLTVAMDDAPVAPIVGSDPVEVEGALAPVLPAEVVDASLPLLRVDVDVDDVRQLPDLGERSAEGEQTQQVLAVGPDGTWVASAGRRLVVGGPETPTSTHAVSHVALAAVLPDGAVVAGLAASPGAPIDRLVHVRDGEATTAVLGTAVPYSSTGQPLVVQDSERLSFAVGEDASTWRALTVWTAQDGVVTDAPLLDVSPSTSDAWVLSDIFGGDERSRVGFASGTVVEVGRADRRAVDIGSWSDQVVSGRRAVGLGWSEDPVSVVVIVGPGAGAAVPVQLPASDTGWTEVAEPLLSVDGALWLRTRDGGVLRLVPASAVETAMVRSQVDSPGRAPLPLAELSAVTPRQDVAGDAVAVAAPGGTTAVPDEAVATQAVHDGLPTGCCWVPSTVAPDGTLALWADPTGPQSRSRDLLVVAPDGTSSRIAARDLYGDVDGPSLAFDESGSLWALADRWWSHAGFPDLVVRRPGEGSFTSLGHLPLGDLLGSDAGRVAFHVEGDEVALVGWTTDAAGREVLAGRVVVAVDGAAVPADDRQAFALPGPSLAITSGAMRPHMRVGVAGAGPAHSMSGPFLGPSMPAVIEHDTAFMGFPHRADLVGGIVVADGPADDSATTTVLVSDRAGTTAGVLVEGAAQPLAAADGSVWAVMDGERLVKILDADWRPAS